MCKTGLISGSNLLDTFHFEVQNRIQNGQSGRIFMPKEVFEIMHMDKKAAQIDEHGRSKIYEKSFLPFNLYLEEEEDIDSLVNNVMNFNWWCASRVLTLDRKYAKEILNSIGMPQAVTDRERARIALSYRCASLTDVFWVRRAGTRDLFADVNLYENHLQNIFMDISLKGRQYTVQNEYLARDLATNGCFPKAWRRTETGFQLLKGGGDDTVNRELLASQIARRFDVSQVLYEPGWFDGEAVSVSDNFTSREYSIASIEAFEIYCRNHDRDTKECVKKLDRHNYYMMNIVDYLTGNTDRHWGNWGVLVKNEDNKPVSLHKLMDFNQAFHAYDTIDGANCQTVFGETMTQREAAEEAVRIIGLNQRGEAGKELFAKMPQYYEMFAKRLAILQRLH